MGDRGNIRIKQDFGDEYIYLYSHWGGTSLGHKLQRALKRNQRWTDGPYLTRIIFCEMMRDSADNPLDEETSFGISTRICDNEHVILTVVPNEQKVHFQEHIYRDDEFKPAFKTFSFAEFIDLDEETLDRLYNQTEGA
jgi:hypothetical protein